MYSCAEIAVLFRYGYKVIPLRVDMFLKRNMTTLSPFLKSPRAQTLTREDRKADSLNRVVSLLLQGVSLHTFQFDPAVTETFQFSIRKLRSRLELVDDEDSALLMAGAAIRLLEENNEAAEAHLHAKQNELEKVIALLSDALLEVSGASEEKMVQVKAVSYTHLTLPTIYS